MNALRSFLLCLLAAGALSAAQGRKWVLAGKPELAFRGLVGLRGVDQPRRAGVLYVNSHHPEDKAGGADLYRVRYRLE